MTTFNIDGPITGIITEAKCNISSLTGGTNASPAQINPGSGGVTVVLLSEGSPSSMNVFQLSSSFNIGDVVELYNDSATHNGMSLVDENGNTINSSALSTNPAYANELIGCILRKVRSGPGRNWGFTD